MGTPSMCTVQLSILDNERRQTTQKGSLCPKTICSARSVCQSFFLFQLFCISCPSPPFPPQWSSLESFLCLLLSKPSHLPNDENGGENTSQENTNRLPCWCAKVGTYALLKIMDNRHKIFSIGLHKQTATGTYS